MSDASDLPPPTDPWAPGVRAIDVPITPGGFPSPFAIEDNASGAEPQFSFSNLPDIPAIAELKKRPRWVAWKYATRKKANGESYQTKPPVNPHNDRGAKVDDPKTWGTYEEAVACALRYGHAGVGYVLTGDDDISGHDLDKVRDRATGKLVDWAQAIVDLGETYTEISPSGAGVRMFWHGKLSAAIKFDAAQVEVYSTGRYLTVTGYRIAGTSDEIRTAPKTLELLRARVETFKEAEARARSEETIIPASEPGVKSAQHRKGEPGGPKKAGHRNGEPGSTSTNPFWRAVNSMALDHRDAWVVDLFGADAVYQPGTGAWRISSAALGRNLEEDLSIAPKGIQDFGTEEGLTAIDVVKWRLGGTAKSAALWLCQRCSVKPEDLGFDPDYVNSLKFFTAPPDVTGTVSAAQPAAGPHGPSADTARDWLRIELEVMMEVSLFWHKIYRDKEPKDRYDAPHKAIKITTGVGKSEAIRLMIAQFVRRAKAKGLSHRVLYLVGTHKLAAEGRIKMPDSVTTAIWQGRDAIKLGTVDEKMCLNAEAVKAAIDIGAVIEETACRKAKRGEDPVFCPVYHACHYQAQKALAGEADVVFAAHELLFKAPTAIGEDFGLVVIDEAFWQDGISGVAAKSRLVIDSLAHELKDAPVRDYYGNRLDLDTEALLAKIELLQTALEQMPDRYVTRRQLIDAGLLAATAWENGSCAQAAKMEWARANVDPGLRPDSGEEDRRKAVKKFGFLKRIPKRWAMWKALEDLINGNDDATGRLTLETEESDDGEQRYIRVLTRKEILQKFASLPVVHLDATMPFELVKHFLPDLRLDLDLNVEAPHMRITQVAGLPVGKSSLVPKTPGKRKGKTKGTWTETPEEAEARVTRRRQDLVEAVRHIAQERRGLAIVYKDIEDDFRPIAGVETAHFGAIEGIDAWGDVEVAVIIGRPLPDPDAIEHTAAAITGLPVDAGPMIEQWRRVGHTGLFLKCRIYATPEAEMIRQAVTEAAIEQAVGRVRGVNRTAANPVEVFVVLSDVVVPGMPVEEAVAFSCIQPDSVDLMIARGLTTSSGADAHELYPDLFPSPDAARQMFKRTHLDIAGKTRRRYWGPASGGHSVTCLRLEGLSKRCHAVNFTMVRYQPSGARRKPRLALVNLVKVPDPRAVLETALGKMVLFEVLTGPAPATAASEAAE